jgi:anhydro-N-acetylmuramic acid kinase
MSGTSFDGVEGVAVQFVPGQPLQILAAASLSFEPALREALFALQTPGHKEIEREAQLANQLAHDYALTTHARLKQAVL